MKDFIFVSDFDGTLTQYDFYKMMSDKYLSEECKPLYKDWRDKKITDIEYLGYVFKNIGQEEEVIHNEIDNIQLDAFAKDFIHNIKNANGDFVIVSAGTSYYIKRVLDKHNIADVKIYSNGGEYRDKGLHFVISKDSEFYSDIYGINKASVVKKLKSEYKKVFYAGDSEPDLNPALISDVVFAKGDLVQMLKKADKPFIEFTDFQDIWNKLKTFIHPDNL